MTATKPLTNNQIIKIGINYGKARKQKNAALFSAWKKANNWNNQTIAWRQQQLQIKPWRQTS